MFLNLQEVCYLVSVKEILKWDYSKECYKLDFRVFLQSWLWPGSALQTKYDPGRKTSEIVTTWQLASISVLFAVRYQAPKTVFNVQSSVVAI